MGMNASVLVVKKNRFNGILDNNFERIEIVKLQPVPTKC